MQISAEQMGRMLSAATPEFEAEMFWHARAFSPRLAQVLGTAPLRLAVRHLLARAAAHGLDQRGPARLYLELGLLHGSGFDTDPQYPWAAQALAGPGSPYQRADRLYEAELVYQDQVAGPEGAWVTAALQRLQDFAAGSFEVAESGLDAALLALQQRLYPQKAAFVGVPGLSRLVDEARSEARRLQFEGARAVALLCALKLAFGHACLRDPLYPWLARSLQQPQDTQPAQRAARLERRALTWLRAVLQRAALPEELAP